MAVFPFTFFITPKTSHCLLSTWVKEAKRAIIPIKVSVEYHHVFLFNKLYKVVLFLNAVDRIVYGGYSKKRCCSGPA